MSSTTPASPQGGRPSQPDVDALVALFQQQRPDLALAPARDMSQRFAQFGFGWLALGVALQQTGQPLAALDAMARAVALLPGDALAHSNLANAQIQAGRLSEATASCQQALQINPQLAQAHVNLGVALSAAGRFEEAQPSYLRALQLQPDFAEALQNLALNLKSLGRLHEALQCGQRLVQLQAHSAPAHSLLGGIFSDLGRHDEAVAHCLQALRLRPDFVEAWGNLLFALNYHPDKSGPEVFDAYRAYDQALGLPLRQAWRSHGTGGGDGGVGQAPRRLKVGYVSPAFRRHSCQYFLEPLLARHDKQAVQVYAYAELAQPDEVTLRYQCLADHWVATQGMTDDALAQRIRDDGIDVLVDLAGHTRGSRLGVFARKPAPVSLHWLDFGYTTGLSAIDYYLCDAGSVPAGALPLFSERPWRLERPALAYRPAAGMGEVGTLPALRNGYVTFGSLTRATRINHHTVRVWSRILHQVPQARLCIDSADFRDAPLQAQLTAQFCAQGIAAERLSIGHHSPPWDVMRGTDITLDCFPHNSGTTLLESLHMGVPFVTLAGRASVGLLGSSILQGLGRPEWIAASEDGYVAIATALATDLPQLARTRAGLRDVLVQSPLMDEVGFARSVEAAYQAMWQQRAAAP